MVAPRRFAGVVSWDFGFMAVSGDVGKSAGDGFGNVSELLSAVASERGGSVAVAFRGESVTFGELNALCDFYARAFRDGMMGRGDLTLMALRPGIELIAAVFAVFRVGAVPVLIDPGMGAKGFLSCVRSVAPNAMVGLPKAHWLSFAFSGAFRGLERRFAIGSGFFPGAAGLPTAGKFKRSGVDAAPAETADTRLSDRAAVLFTSGATGPPKGVVYTHGIFIEQTRLIGEFYGAGPKHVDMPCFPLFGLFSAALGMPCVVPDFDPSFPAKADPKLIVDTIRGHEVSFSFASPTLWRNVASYCLENGIRLPSLKKALMAGAPVPPSLHADLRKIIAEDGDTYVPYGATESLPAANLRGSELTAELAERVESGEGYCVGKPLPGVGIRIIKPVDHPIREWGEAEELPVGEVGEIVVSGKIVTPEYLGMPDHTALAKIAEPDGGTAHRIGDMGRVDGEGRIWFLGRKTHRIFTKSGVIYPVQVEALFNRHSHVARSALVGVGPKGEQIPALVVEPVPGVLPMLPRERRAFIADLEKIAAENPLASEVGSILIIDALPVDIRHNAKIDRLALAKWAGKRVPPA